MDELEASNENLQAQLAQRDEMLAKVREECDSAVRTHASNGEGWVWVPVPRILAILGAGAGS